MDKINLDEVSPMMQEYLKTKEDYPDCLLFYRLGDFYEMFFDDAKTASKELDLTLTGKNCGLKERAPMCGIPYHAVDIYIAKLVEKGYKVAVCEQMEDPRFAKGLVKREVTRIVTPGTITAAETLDETRNNYIFAVFYEIGSNNLPQSAKAGIAVCDISTGDFYATQIQGNQKIRDEINKYSPSEIVCNQAFLMSSMDLEDLRTRLGIAINQLDSHYFGQDEARQILLDHFKVASLTALDLADMKYAQAAAGALMQYLYDTQKNSLSNITRIQAYASGKYMLLDSATRRNLELTETMREKRVKGSLLWVLDRTKTAMGARLLRQYLEQPLVEKDEIEARYDAIDALSKSSVDRDEIREYLSPIYDMERLLTKISYGSANPRDLVAFRESLKMTKPIRQVLSGFPAKVLQGICRDISDFSELTELLDRAIVDDPPLAMKDGGILKPGYDETVDHYRNVQTNGKQILADLEEKTREATGIKTLKIKFNNVFGYFFEVTNQFRDQVPPTFERKQTLVGSERYTTPELKQTENEILNAREKLGDLEYEAFAKLRDLVASKTPEIQKAAKAIAALDVFCSLSLVSERNRYVRPTLNDKGVIRIREGRHPVVEQMMQGDFVANDTILDNKKNCIAIITGPNMAGKSTYMRQVALICLMAQIGCFVPADAADLCVVDRIFTRVGASDDLGSGQSTFMVEMNEVANILRNATPKSLLILDEIGRGTSTYDGLSIAWAVVEYIANRKFLGAKTLFATHYHELTELEGKLDSVNNYCVAVKEKGDDIIFLRKIIKGGADRSYGIQVAKLAGLPDMVVDRAKEIAEELAGNDITENIQSIEVKSGEEGAAARKKVPHYDDVDLGQMSLFETSTDDSVLTELRTIDIQNMTPMDALNTLYRLQSELKNRWESAKQE